MKILLILVFANIANTKILIKNKTQTIKHPVDATGYRWTILPQFDDYDLCNNQKCQVNGLENPHTLCYDFPNNMSSQCKKFSMLKTNARKFILGHNGLRNRVAKTESNYVKNMNYVHWDDDLKIMAESWLRQCNQGKDPCEFIYNESYPVGQNHVFFKRQPGKRWEQKAMREWFIEMKSVSAAEYDKLPLGRGNNFTQMVWAEVQFIGCAGAKMFGGFLVACYYYPKGNIPLHPIFLRGSSEDDICTECPTSKATCSKILTGLCGLDDEHILERGSAVQPVYPKFIMLILIAINLLAAQKDINLNSYLTS